MVEKAQERALQPLKDRRQDVEKEAKSITDEHQEEANRLEKTISELHGMTMLEDHVLCLQVGGRLQTQHGMDFLKALTRVARLDCLPPFPSQSFPSLEDMDSEWTEIEFDTSLSFGTMRKVTAGLLEEIQQELEKLTATGESLNTVKTQTSSPSWIRTKRPSLVGLHVKKKRGGNK